MTTPHSTEPIKIGTLVKVLNSGYHRAQVVEYRGPLGPKGARIYRVCYRRKPRPAYTEVREDQLEILSETRDSHRLDDEADAHSGGAIDPGEARGREASENAR